LKTTQPTFLAVAKVPEAEIHRLHLGATKQAF